MDRCDCPESKLVVNAYLGQHMDTMRQGYLVALCPEHKTRFHYRVADCFVLAEKTPLSRIDEGV